MTKKLISLCGAVVLAVPMLAWAQNTSQNSDQQNTQSQPNTQSQNTNQSDQNNKQQKMSGKVSNNGKTFTNDQDSKKYTVDNPSALDGQQDQHVNLVVAVDPDSGTIHVIQVLAPPQ